MSASVSPAAGSGAERPASAGLSAEPGDTSSSVGAPQPPAMEETAVELAENVPSDEKLLGQETQMGNLSDEGELVEETDDEDEDGRIAEDIEMAIEKLPESQRRAKMREILSQRRKDPKPRVLKPRKPGDGKKQSKQ